MTRIRNLIVVLGDQLNHDSSAFDDFDASCDRVWMAENQEEATHVWCHKFRLVAFFAPMRHFRDELKESGKEVIYHELPKDGRKARTSSFASLLRETLESHPIERVVMVQPGDYRVEESIRSVVDEQKVKFDKRDDRSFFCSIEQFADWADGRKSMVLEQFYRTMRKEHDVLVDADGKPEGGDWNYDSENRGKFGKGGPKDVPSLPSFRRDKITEEVIEMVNSRFADHPGKCDGFDLPVNRDQALAYLDDFVSHRLSEFGTYQDAMWSEQKFLYHSRLSNAINLHLLSPREVVDAAIVAYKEDQAPLNSVEGFIRQILGWREYVRGMYWTRMPEYGEKNALQCDESQDVPSFFWDGETKMACVADSMRLLIETAYAHHIQRLMVLGLFAQLYGVHPSKFNDWHMAMYADAIDWVSLPNALGMSQHGDGGVMATKPYCASGNYINRMSNYCKSCPYKPGEATGEDACPFTTLYWDFLDRHYDRFKKNNRMAMQLKHVERKDKKELHQIRVRAKQIREGAIEI
ncbi:Deoxyribodipyrimidine photo-lyase-related protein [Rubripirellula amarantea]|uniref:Deoxyribodipyrimidine photo-lyase-related protein n=1 Tax=Rubripirellula amarantea TaxID=2527999 RepID=A0A5C5WUJ2_9BACT|nr:cryptochrome/photolyase family protein [Rubripirellula amarantea]TWT54407.1 Deoxyribodipyrimidine photo-lyase-related protein [Rubripirellula amarantea]